MGRFLRWVAVRVKRPTEGRFITFSYMNLFGYARPPLTGENRMSVLDVLVGPLTSIIDKVIPDKEARAKAKLALIELEGTQELRQLEVQLSAIVAEANSTDPWTSRARPSFLYVMYAMILWALPIGVLSLIRPEAASAIASAMSAYLRGLPEELYALFGTGYLGYTAARQWGKIKGVDG
jgi:hypothetical protein